MAIQNTIGDAVNFFQIEVRSSTILLRINFDLQLTFIGNSLYCRLGQRVGVGLETSRCDTLFHKLVPASATIDIRPHGIEIRFRRRATTRSCWPSTMLSCAAQPSPGSLTAHPSSDSPVAAKPAHP